VPMWTRPQPLASVSFQKKFLASWVGYG